MERTNNDDPSATYRGFRRQALYCLYRLFDDALPHDTVVQPEGNEDLEIRTNGGVRLEVVQVKDYSDPLKISHFKHSYYRRIGELCADDTSVQIKIASFGEFGPELAQAYDNQKETPNRSLRTVTADKREQGQNKKRSVIRGLSKSEAENVFRRTSLERVNELALTESVMTKLRATVAAGNPDVVFENLMWWLISSAEKQRSLTRRSTIEKLTELGRFITERDSHAEEWNTSIHPIVQRPAKGEDRERLQREFFQAGRVRLEHVAAGFDVPREDALVAIHSAFQKESIVVLRGASGQGKTTLAYRYLLDWTPSTFRYEVKRAANLQHARKMAAALSGHAAAIDVPTVVFLDVNPGDTHWVEFVRELSSPNIRVLVVIREEDWFRARVSLDDFPHTDLTIELSEESALRIFDKLVEPEITSNRMQLDFDDAWAKLGENKRLFEFIYLVTQSEDLPQRIRKQVAHLKDEANRGLLSASEFKLLRLTSAASAYETRLDLRALAAAVGLPDPGRALERFENEYLVRTSDDGRNIEGFHAIRSELLVRELTDKVIHPRGEVESEIIELVVEEDLESFLLCSFSRHPESAELVLAKIHQTRFKTWTGIRAVLSALQWMDIQRYMVQNTALLREVRSQWGASWWLLLDWDLAQVAGPGGSPFLDMLAESSERFAAGVELAAAFRARQSDKELAHSLARDWLNNFALPIQDPTSAADVSAAGDVLYWAGRLVRSRNDITTWIDDSEFLSGALERLPLHMFAHVASGTSEFSDASYKAWLNENRDTLTRRLHTECNIFSLTENNGGVTAHFIINKDWNDAKLSPSEDAPTPNELSVERVDILHACVPGYTSYGACGYGHKSSLFEFHDESEKQIPIENLSVPRLARFNGIALGCVDVMFRPSSWTEHFEDIETVRASVAAAIFALAANLAKKIRPDTFVVREWEDAKKCLKHELLLPACAVDEWGFVSESRQIRRLGIHDDTAFCPQSIPSRVRSAITQGR